MGFGSLIGFIQIQLPHLRYREFSKLQVCSDIPFQRIKSYIARHCQNWITHINYG